MTMMNDPHTAKAFDNDLQDIARMVAEMGGLAEKQVAEAVDALAKRDTVLAPVSYTHLTLPTIYSV